MKKLFTAVLISLLGLSVYAQTWTTGTGVLYTNPSTTKVGIGISPTELFHINNGALKIGNSTSANDRAINMIKIGDGSYIKIGEWEADDKLSFYAAQGYSFTGGAVNFGNVVNFGGVTNFTSTVNFTSKLGIHTANPQAPLHLHGGSECIEQNIPHRQDNQDGSDLTNEDIDGSDSASDRNIPYATNYCNVFLMTTSATGASFSDGFHIRQDNSTVTLKQQEDASFHLYGKAGSGITIAPNGNVGLGISSPTQKLHVVGNSFFNGNVGIGTNSPQRKLDVNGDIAAKNAISINEGGIASIYLGEAYGANLGYGTSAIGFNAIRNSANGTWKFEGDGANNGGSVIWSSVDGDIYFASIPTTGSYTKTMSDNQIRQNIKLQLRPDGILKAKDVLVTLSNWPDFVFAPEYKLPALSETEAYIKENGHLPEIPSAKEVEENGVSLGEMQGKLLQKIEELTIYTIEQQKLIEDLQKRLVELESKKGGE